MLFEQQYRVDYRDIRRARTKKEARLHLAAMTAIRQEGRGSQMVEGLTDDEVRLVQAYRASNAEDKEWILQTTLASAKEANPKEKALRLIINNP